MFDEGSKFPPFFSALCNISMALIIMIVVVVELRRLYEHRSSSLCWWWCWTLDTAAITTPASDMHLIITIHMSRQTMMLTKQTRTLSNRKQKEYLNGLNSQVRIVGMWIGWSRWSRIVGATPISLPGRVTGAAPPTLRHRSVLCDMPSFMKAAAIVFLNTKMSHSVGTQIIEGPKRGGGRFRLQLESYLNGSLMSFFP